MNADFFCNYNAKLTANTPYIYYLPLGKQKTTRKVEITHFFWDIDGKITFALIVKN
jgi:hypothetical protein